MIVIADDITGAAEIAGIAHEHGLPVRLLAAGSVCCHTKAIAATVVIATDTRSMSEADAVAETRRIATHLPLLLEGDGERLLFKKTDSALRGHVVAELAALMEATGMQRAVYLPANPSKGRIIRARTYYIYNQPIHETDFSFDPEFPARTSSLAERFPDAAAHNILMPDAETEDDLRRVIQQYNDSHTLFAGAADLFRSLMLTPPLSVSQQGSGGTKGEVSGSSTLILCGSTQSRPLDLGIPVAEMPREVYDGEQGADEWYASLTAQHSSLNALILTIPHTHRTGKEVAVHLRTVMAEMTRRLVARHQPDHLIIEGGATAWATLNALGWTNFDIVHQFAPGVVQMRADSGTLVTLKPGSYPWGGLLKVKV